MIVKKTWKQLDHGHVWLREGWYLFGILPLFIHDVTSRGVFYHGRRA